MCVIMFYVLLVVSVMVGSVAGLEFQSSLSLASEWYSPRQVNIAQVVCVL